MLQGLSRLLFRIERERLPEAAVYRTERSYRRDRGRRVPRGVLGCPVCGRRASSFLSFGLGGRRNAQCPTCGSLERHRFLWLYIVRRTRLLKSRARVLHTAPEPWLKERLKARPGLRYLSVDRFDPAADLHADLVDLPLADASFDWVLSSHTLEHVPEQERAIAELARVLKPGGRAIVMVPFDPRRPTVEGRDVADPAERMRRFGHPYHYRINGNDFPRHLRKAGLDPSIVDSRDMLTPHQRRLWRVNRNHLFDCVRRG